MVRGAALEIVAAVLGPMKGADGEARKVDAWRLTLQRRAGMLLAEMPKAKPVNPKPSSDRRSDDATDVPTYAELGIGRSYIALATCSLYWCGCVGKEGGAGGTDSAG